jgi:hypothetical protein
MKSNIPWVMKTAWTKEEDAGVSWHLEEPGHTSTSLEYMDDEVDADERDGIIGQVKKEGEVFRT